MTTVKTYEMKDSGATVELTKGEEIKVSLEANATTGYEWKIAEIDDSVIKLVNSDYRVNSERNITGAGGYQNYTFKVVGQGSTKLEIIYHRSWEKNKKPLKTFDLIIDSR